MPLSPMQPGSLSWVLAAVIVLCFVVVIVNVIFGWR